TLPWDLWTT
nr:Chain P, AMPHIPHYSIN [Homo sapiens]1UTC_Q Chain Q, AMPHIPHYSIN [Homo sapiens]